MKNKKGVMNFSFAWIFAIIAGAFILFIAIFAVYKFMHIGSSLSDAETAKDIDVLMNPLESGFETGKKTLISTNVDTRIYASCSDSGFFGKQFLKVSQEIYNKWSDTNTTISSKNKYIFSEDYVEGKNFYLYSKPFEFPFKVADLIYLTSSEDKYCFVNAPDEIKNEIKNWNSENLILDNCFGEYIKICFEDKENCDVVVDESEKTVGKNGDLVYYEGNALMYAGIFSNKENYECQLKRLMKRTEQLSLIYKDKARFLVSNVECSSTIVSNLVVFANQARNFEGSENLELMSIIAEDINDKNEKEECRLW